MVNFKKEIAKIFIEKISDIGLTFDDLYALIEIPTDEKMGDYAFPCFRLAKVMRKAPPVIAKELAEKLKGTYLFSKVENVNGYVNIYIDRDMFTSAVLPEVINEKENFGSSNIGQNKKVIVEFSSPNIAKPFHIGHIRSTVIGNSIYKINTFLGYDTVRINHLGDYGTQFGKMIVAYKKWGNKEDVINEPIKTLLSYYVKFHEEAKEDEALEDEARATFTRLENGEPEEIQLWQWFRDESLKEFNRVYGMLGITFDSYAGESFYSDKMQGVIDKLNDSNLLKESDGAMIVDLEDYNMGPALIQKQDGSTLYITRDIAAAIYRKETYDFYKNIYVVASQQNLHFQQLIKIIELMGYDWYKDCIHIPFGLVSLADGTMSTRSGNVVFLEDVLNGAVEKTKDIVREKGVSTDNIDEISRQVGIGAVIFQELSNNRIKDYVFSWDKVLNFEGETGPYVQYTCARACSVLVNAFGNLKKAEEALSIEAAKDTPSLPWVKHISGDSAYMLTKMIYKFPDTILDAAGKNEPSVVTRHIVDVAQAFNRFYHDEHILVDDEEERLAKLMLVYAAKQTISNGLALLGIESPERM